MFYIIIKLNYSTNQINIKQKRFVSNENENIPCHNCKKQIFIIGYTYDDIIEVCEKCWKNWMMLQQDDRIKIINGEYEGKFGIIQEVNDEKSTTIRVEGFTNSIFIQNENFIKLIPEMLSEESLCKLCYFCLYSQSKYCCNEKCSTMCENCCRQYLYCCPFCRSIYKDKAVKISHDSLMKSHYVNEILEKFGVSYDGKRILYGVVKHVEWNKTNGEFMYEIEISDDYNWPKDIDGKIIQGQKLNLGLVTHTIYTSGKELQIFRPPSSSQNRQVGQRATLIELLNSNISLAMQEIYLLRGVNMRQMQREMMLRRILSRRYGSEESILTDVLEHNSDTQSVTEIGSVNSVPIYNMNGIEFSEQNTDNDDDEGDIVPISYESQMDMLDVEMANSQIDDSRSDSNFDEDLYDMNFQSISQHIYTNNDDVFIEYDYNEIDYHDVFIERVYDEQVENEVADTNSQLSDEY